MPITQGRMIALINAAEDYKQALLRVEKQLIKLQTQHYDTVPMSEIQVLVTDVGFMVQELVKHDVTIATEYYKFRTNYGRNERERLKMQIKRRAAGVPARVQPQLHYNEHDRLVPRDNTAAPREQTYQQKIQAELDQDPTYSALPSSTHEDEDSPLDKFGTPLTIIKTDDDKDNQA